MNKEWETYPTEMTSKREHRVGTWVELPKADVRAAAEKAEGLLTALETFEICDLEHAEIAGQLLKEVHEEIKRLDKIRKDAGKPARDAQRAINDYFKPPLTLLEKAKREIKRRLEVWQATEDERRREAIAKAAEGDTEALADTAPAAPVAGVATRRVIEVLIDDERKIPREFLIVDMRKLQSLANAGGEAPTGVRFVAREAVVVGR